MQHLVDSFRVATEADLDAILVFRKQFFPNGLPWDDRQYLRWRYTFSDAAAVHGRYWILEIDGELLGTIGMETFNLVVNGELKPASHPLDLMAKPDLKGIGIGAWLNLAAMEKTDLVFVLGSSDEAEGLVRKIYHPLSHCVSWKLPINILGSLKHKIRVPGLTHVLAAFWDAYSAVSRKVKFRGLMPVGAEVKPLDRFSSKVDQLSTHFGDAKIFRHRCKEYLNWRFIENPCTDYIVLALYADGKHLVAYGIYHMVYSSNNGQIEAIIDDVFWREDEVKYNRHAYLKAMLSSTVLHAISGGAKLIQAEVNSGALSEALRSLGFYPRGDASVCGVYARDAALTHAIYDNASWFITLGDAHGEYFSRNDHDGSNHGRSDHGGIA